MSGSMTMMNSRGGLMSGMMQQTRGGSVTIPKGSSMMVAQPGVQRAQAQYQCINPGKVSLSVSLSLRVLLHACLQARMICAPNVISGGVFVMGSLLLMSVREDGGWPFTSSTCIGVAESWSRATRCRATLFGRFSINVMCAGSYTPGLPSLHAVLTLPFSRRGRHAQRPHPR